jgi:hypothetical protein
MTVLDRIAKPGRTRPSRLVEADRLLIAGGTIWVWVFAGSDIVLGPGLVLAPLAAIVLWREVRSAAVGLLIAALGLLAWSAWLAAGQLPSGAVVGLGAVAVAVGSARHLAAPSPSRAERLAAVTTSVSMAPDDLASRIADDLPDVAADPVLYAFLAEVARLDRDALRVLGAARPDVAPDDLAAARRLAGGSVPAGRVPALREAAGLIDAWSRGDSGSPWTWQFGAMHDIDRADLRRRATPVLLDVATAILARDRMDAASLATMADPWLALGASPVWDRDGSPATGAEGSLLA